MQVKHRLDNINMITGIMQPYFFPYIGYYQLLNLSDTFVVYDDVNFIKGGWIIRNRILNGGKVQYYNTPMLGASSNKLISNISVDSNPAIWEKNKRIIYAAYEKAPYFRDVYPILKDLLTYSEANLADYLCVTIKELSNFLGIKTDIILSSSLTKNNKLKGQEKVIQICKIMQSTYYINAIGGQALYNFDAFRNEGIILKFIKTQDVTYHQLHIDHFYPNLSIIDVLMNNSKEVCKNFLDKYQLIGEL